VCPEGPAAPVLRDRERERAELGAETSSVFQFVIVWFTGGARALRPAQVRKVAASSREFS